MTTPTEQPIKVLIKLSNRLLCDALQEVLRRESQHFDTAACVGCSEPPPHAIIVDENSLADHTRSTWPNSKIILIDNGIGEERIINNLINSRIDGVLSTNTDIELLKKALFAVHKGQVWIDNSKLKALLSHVETISSSSSRDELSKKERDIVILVSRGMRNREIAEELHISEQTVKSHLSRIFRKTNVTSRSQLVPLAIKFSTPASV